MRKGLMILLLAAAVSADSAWHMGPFQKRAEPIFLPSASGLDDKNVYNMAVVQDGERFRMVYRGESRHDTAETNTGRLFLADSADGVNWTRESQPVMVNDQPYESRGVEDPRIVRVENTWYLTYTAYDGKLARLCEATSTDLRHWSKRGPIFPDFAEGNEVSPVGWTKSGAILAQSVHGQYVMYFGESDMWMATSPDMLHWTYRKEPVLRRRPGMGDSRVCEPGPPPLRTRDGILLLYAGDRLDKHPYYVTYAALFDAEHPERVLRRAERPLLEPTLPWEIEGYVPHVVFAESLLHVGHKWRLYYGGADHVIGLAEAPYDPALLP